MRSPVRRPLITRDAFQALWLGQTVSALGTQVSMVALPLIAVLTLHVGPFELGVLAALETVPYLLLSLPAGAVVDRLDHRATMIACDVGRALALLVTTAAMVLGVLSIGLLYVVALVVGSMSVFFTVAYTSYLAGILPAERLIAGNQRLELSESGARVAGPSIGGALLQFAGGAAAMALDGISYVVSALAIASTGRSVTSARTRAAQTGFMESMGAGLGHVLRDRILRDIAGSTAIFNLGSGMILAVLVLFATQEVGLDAAGFGLVYGLGNVGFVLGAMLVGAMTDRFGVGRSFAWSSFASAGAMVLIAVAGTGVGAVFLLAGRFVGAIATPIYNVDALSLRQARVSEAIIGRVNGTFQFLEWGALPVGSLVGGVLGAALGPRSALAAAAVCGVVSAIWISTSPARRLTSLTQVRPADPTIVDPSNPSVRPPLVA
jgi:MFS family permease